jgi:hypothetical protein
MSPDPNAPDPTKAGFAAAAGSASDSWTETPTPAVTPAPDGSPGFTHFDSPYYPTTYVLPPNMEPAAPSHDEQVGTWLGPVNIPRIPAGYTVNRGWGRRGRAETDTNAINTLLFTNLQVIGVMLGPDDLQNLSEMGPLKSAANMFVGKQFEGGIEKGVQFGALNANHWKDMVDALTAQPLVTALRNHLNFGLPYERIKTVELKSRFINPGLTFHLGDGTDLGYRTFRKDKLAEIGAFLTQQFVTVR